MHLALSSSAPIHPPLSAPFIPQPPRVHECAPQRLEPRMRIARAGDAESSSGHVAGALAHPLLHANRQPLSTKRFRFAMLSATTRSAGVFCTLQHRS